MKFSIIVPVYNVEEYIAPCIDSVLHQSHPDFEIILVDDGSKDGSGAICDRYAQSYPNRISVFHGENKGPHMARMKGIDHVSGDAVLFVDADDMLRANALELLERKFHEAACDMICFDASQKSDFSTAFLEFPFEDGKCFEGETKKQIYEATIGSSSMNPLWLKAVKRELLYDIPPNCRDFSGRNAEDLWLSLPLLTAAQKILYINQNLYYYRVRPQSTVHSYNPVRHRSIKKVHTEMEKYIDRWGMAQYHARHYAREVRGWIDCLKMMLAHTAQPQMQLIKELGEDEYFRKAYTAMEPGRLSGPDALLGKWLYAGKYRRILLAGQVLRRINALKQFVKGHGKI